jgi:hypothetical protein
MSVNVNCKQGKALQEKHHLTLEPVPTNQDAPSDEPDVGSSVRPESSSVDLPALWSDVF